MARQCAGCCQIGVPVYRWPSDRLASRPSGADCSVTRLFRGYYVTTFGVGGGMGGAQGGDWIMRDWTSATTKVLKAQYARAIDSDVQAMAAA
eukprot:893935-Prorocentrum_minimum.AAC.2